MTDSQTPNQPDPRGEAYESARHEFYETGDIRRLEEYHLRQIRWLRYSQRVINRRSGALDAELTDAQAEKVMAEVALEVVLPAAHSRPIQADWGLIQGRRGVEKVLKNAGQEDFFGHIAAEILLNLVESQSVEIQGYTAHALSELPKAFFYTSQANFGGEEHWEDLPEEGRKPFRVRAMQILSTERSK